MILTIENSEVSSANNLVFNAESSYTFLIHIRNNNNLRIKPYGTPASTSGLKNLAIQYDCLFSVF